MNLSAGEGIFCYTDGVTDAMSGEEHVFYGNIRLNNNLRRNIRSSPEIFIKSFVKEVSDYQIIIFFQLL